MYLKKFWVFFLLVCNLIFAEPFFHRFPDAGANLPADGLYPAGRRMMFGGYSPRLEDISELQASGFSCLGPVYGGKPAFYAKCRELKMPYLYTVNAKGITLNRLSAKEPLDWPAIEADIRKQILEASGDKLIACWYLQPEELRYWRTNEFRYFQTAARIIRETDPLKRPVWSYLPGHYGQKGLEKYAPHLDILGKGMYVNYANHKDSRVWVRYSSEGVAGAVRETGSSAMPLSVPEMFKEPAEGESVKIPSWVRHDVYGSLISGCKGVVIFSLAPRAKFPSWRKYYDSYRKVAGELKELGPVFLFGHECRDLAFEIVSGVKEASCSVRISRELVEKKYPAVSFRNYSYQGRRYLFAVNSAETAVTAKWTGFPDMNLKVRDCTGGTDGGRIAQGSLVLEFAPLEVKLLEFVQVNTAASMDEFFRSSLPEDYQKLSGEKVFPQGRKFPFSFYSCGGGTDKGRNEIAPAADREADQREMVEAGITMMGPQYELNEMTLEAARKFHVFQVYTIYPKVTIDGKERRVDLTFFRDVAARKIKFDEAQLREAVAREVKAVAHRPEIAWWDVTPEELRFWRRNERRFLELACETIRANDPLKRPMFMYEPGHRTGKGLAKLLPLQDFSVKGTYVNYSGHKTNRIWARYSIEQQVEAVKIAAQTDPSRKRYAIALPEMFKEPAAEELALVPAWVRHDVYVSLIHGAKGVMVFSASRRPNFQARKNYLDAYLEVCRQLNGKMNLGQVFLFGERKNDMTCTVVEGPKSISCRVGKKEIPYSPASFAVYGWQGKRYVFLVNSANEAIRTEVKGMIPGGRIAIRNILTQEKASPVSEDSFTVALKPLETAIFEVSHK